jgi:predicted alpha/beta-hydrolase family hydrolase
LAVQETLCQLESAHGALDATWVIPDDPVAALVFSHGAGAGHHHATMQSLAEHFADQKLATFRYNFPYMQAGKNRVDKTDVATEIISLARNHVQGRLDVPLFLCGHSFGGRMNSHAVVEREIDCAGLIFCSFPLHLAKKPADKRAAHLPDITQPMLFLSGTRDDLADAPLLTEVVSSCQQAQLHWLETANHSYTILKRTRQNPQSVFAEIAEQARRFVDEMA